MVPATTSSAGDITDLRAVRPPRGAGARNDRTRNDLLVRLEQLENLAAQLDQLKPAERSQHLLIRQFRDLLHLEAPSSVANCEGDWRNWLSQAIADDRALLNALAGRARDAWSRPTAPGQVFAAIRLLRHADEAFHPQPRDEDVGLWQGRLILSLEAVLESRLPPGVAIRSIDVQEIQAPGADDGTVRGQAWGPPGAVLSVTMTSSDGMGRAARVGVWLEATKPETGKLVVRWRRPSAARLWKVLRESANGTPSVLDELMTRLTQAQQVRARMLARVRGMEALWADAANDNDRASHLLGALCDQRQALRALTGAERTAWLSKLPALIDRADSRALRAYLPAIAEAIGATGGDAAAAAYGAALQRTPNLASRADLLAASAVAVALGLDRQRTPLRDAVTLLRSPLGPLLPAGMLPTLRQWLEGPPADDARRTATVSSTDGLLESLLARRRETGTLTAIDDLSRISHALLDAEWQAVARQVAAWVAADVPAPLQGRWTSRAEHQSFFALFDAFAALLGASPSDGVVRAASDIEKYLRAPLPVDPHSGRELYPATLWPALREWISTGDVYPATKRRYAADVSLAHLREYWAGGADEHTSREEVLRRCSTWLAELGAPPLQPQRLIDELLEQISDRAEQLDCDRLSRLINGLRLLCPGLSEEGANIMVSTMAMAKSWAESLPNSVERELANQWRQCAEVTIAGDSAHRRAWVRFAVRSLLEEEKEDGKAAAWIALLDRFDTNDADPIEWDGTLARFEERFSTGAGAETTDRRLDQLRTWIQKSDARSVRVWPGAHLPVDPATRRLLKVAALRRTGPSLLQERVRKLWATIPPQLVTQERKLDLLRFMLWCTRVEGLS